MANSQERPTQLRKDVNPWWVNLIFWVLGAISSVLQLVFGSNSVKLLGVVASTFLFLVTKIPFYFRSVSAQKGSGVWRNCKYGPRPRNRLDVYFPSGEHLTKGSRFGKAIILFIHGGAWHWGDKLHYSLMQSNSFPQCTLVVINYSLHPTVQCDTMVQDISLAIKWVKVNLLDKQQGSVSAPLMVAGHSAGAHLLALTMLRRCGIGIKEAADKKLHCRECDEEACVLHCPVAIGRGGNTTWGWGPEDITGVILMSGVYQISDHYLHEKGRGVHEVSPMCGNRKTFPAITTAGRGPPVMGKGPEEWDHFSPTQLLRDLKDGAASAVSLGAKHLPPTFLIHGTSDITVPVSSSVRFFEALQGVGHPLARLRYFAGADHSGMICMDLTDANSIWSQVMSSEILDITQAASTFRAHGSPAVQHFGIPASKPQRKPAPGPLVAPLPTMYNGAIAAVLGLSALICSSGLIQLLQQEGIGGVILSHLGAQVVVYAFSLFSVFTVLLSYFSDRRVSNWLYVLLRGHRGSTIQLKNRLL